MIRKSQAVAVLKKAGHRVTVVGPVLVVNGSGSTGVACLKLRQPCILVEKDLSYFNLAVAWLTAVHKGTPWNPTEYRNTHLTKA